MKKNLYLFPYKRPLRHIISLKKVEPYDQGIHNYLIYSNFFKDVKVSLKDNILTIFVEESSLVENVTIKGPKSKTLISDLKKKLLIFELSSKKKIVLISIKKSMNNYEIENLGAELHGMINNAKSTEYFVNSDSIISSNKNFIGHFLHGLKLKSYNFRKYKTKNEKKLIKSIIGDKKICYVDIGTNQGSYIDFLRSFYSFKKIYSFEPIPELSEKINENYSNFNIKTFKIALSNTNKKKIFYQYIYLWFFLIQPLEKQKIYLKRK